MQPTEKQPKDEGYFGDYGGQFVPETLMSPLEELTQAYREARRSEDYRRELDELLRVYVGRPTPLYPARRLSESLGFKLYLKREDLCHTGAHKINNALGQALLAKRMGKTRVIAETGAGQHGVATAAACALLGLECEIYMGTDDMQRQALNVFRMELMGAGVTPVPSGSRTLKDAINEGMRDWVTNVRNTHYLMGSVLGPHPYPTMVREFQSIVGKEARQQVLEQEGRLPDFLVACVGGGSNAMGLFHSFLDDPGVRMVGVEAGGRGPELGQHAARFEGGCKGVLHGTFSYVLQDERGQIASTHSISAGLDYPSVGPEHAFLHDSQRVDYVTASDEEALAAFGELSRLEGIIPALESAHGLAYCIGQAKDLQNTVVIANLSGRGDKDVEIIRNLQKK